MKNFFKEISSYLIIIIVVVLIRSFIMTPVIVDGPSMEKTLYDGELLILNKLSKRFNNFKRFDIVVINDTKDSELIIKRIIGLPGDKVEYKDEKLYINDKLIKKDYANGYGNTENFTISDICKVSNSNGNCNYDKVPEDYYLVLGDNRGVSWDSRYIGFISKKDIKGTVGFRIWPLNKFGLID